MNLSPRARFAARIAGYVLLGFVTFIYALHLTFPYGRVKDRMIEAVAGKYDVVNPKGIGVERGITPGRFALTNVTLRSRPSVAGQPVTTMFFKRIEVDVAFLPLVSGKAEVGLDISTGAGSMSGTIKASKSSLVVDFTLKKVPLANLPGISDAVGLPLGGNGDGRVTLNLPKGDWTKATGFVKLTCTIGCTVGDDVTRIYPKGKREADQLMLKSGIPVNTVNVSRFVLGIRIAKGEAKKEVFEFDSPDGKIELDFNIKLAKKINDSIITGCIRYQCAPDYQRKSAAACDLGSPVIDRDGFHNIKLTGKLATMKRLGAVCDAGNGAATEDDNDAFSGGGIDKSRRDRPTLDIVLPEAPADAGAGTVPPVEMGKPMPMADDVNPRLDAAGATGPAGASSGGSAVPPSDQGIVAPPPPPLPPPPVPGTEAPIEGEAPVLQPNGDHSGSGNGANGGVAPPNGTTYEPVR